MSAYYVPGVFFNNANIVHDLTSLAPDISKLEARMFFYFMAKRFIDLGYKEITPDYISHSVGTYEDLSTLPNDQIYWAHDVLQKVRDYAASISQLLVICSDLNDPISANPSGPNIDEFYYQGNAMFDFRYGATRPKEVTGISPAFANFNGYMTTALSSCSGQTNTVLSNLDPNSEIIWPTSGGFAPYSGNYYDRIPFLIGLDNYSGICQLPGGIATGHLYCPWGYDESYLFNTLTDPCQADYMRYIYMQSRTFYYRGFVGMPGLKSVNPGPNGKQYLRYRLYDHDALQNVIENSIWKVEPAQYSYFEYCDPISPTQNYISLTVDNPDNSSIYTWHVECPDGSWLPYTYGYTRQFRVTMPGTYHVGLRQDSWDLERQGYPLGVYGQDIYITVNPTLCGPYLKIPVNTTNTLNDLSNITFNSSAITLDTTQNNNLSTLLEKEVQYGLALSPNPATNTLNIEGYIGNSHYISLEIYDAIGKLEKVVSNLTVNSDGTVKNFIDISNLKPGLYIVTINTDNLKTTKKLTVIK